MRRYDTQRIDRILARLRRRQLELAIAGRYVESGRYADRAAKLVAHVKQHRSRSQPVA